MTHAVSNILLLDVANDVLVAAELWDAITEQQLIDWESQWIPELHNGLMRLRDAGVPRDKWPQSRRWDWRDKYAAFQGFLGSQGFSIMCEDVTQGLMIVDMTSKRVREESCKGKHLVYAEFVESAPWNRNDLLCDSPKFRLVGSCLIRAAAELSKSEGFKGRIGLHSLPQADDFYRSVCGMTDFGKDSNYKHHLRYFEMTEEQAGAFLSRGQQT